jgi:prepilin-type N-terminal cleavage/methylation domain-containing protein
MVLIFSFFKKEEQIMQRIKSGFSLIELLVVVAIIGILAAIGTVGYNKYINYAKDAVTKSNLAQLAEALKVEDSKRGSCSTTDPTVCVNELATNANMKDPYLDQNLVVLNDSSLSYAAPIDYNTGARQWQPNGIALLLCAADPPNGPQFIPDVRGNAYSTKHFALKATLLSGETIFQTLDFVNLVSGDWACGG